jgi:hypothetical protein
MGKNIENFARDWKMGTPILGANPVIFIMANDFRVFKL